MTTPTDSADIDPAPAELSPNRLRAVALSGLCLAAFMATGMAVSNGYRATTAPPVIDVLDEKTEDYAQQAANYDIVFIGSSQTFRHITPAIIDAQLEQCGKPLRSYNFGVPALRMPEMYEMVDVLVAANPQPDLVIVQNPLRAETQYGNMISDRGRFYRHGEHIDESMQDVLCYTGTWQGQARSAYNNFRAIIAEGFGLGRLGQRLFSHNRSNPRQSYNPAYRTAAGFWPVDQDGSHPVSQRAISTPMTDQIIRDGLDDVGFAPRQSVASCRARQIGTIFQPLQAAGMEVMFLSSPNPRDSVHDDLITQEVRSAYPEIPVLDFNASTVRETYYEKDLWFDSWHMNGEGAAILSAQIGTALCESLDE